MAHPDYDDDFYPSNLDPNPGFCHISTTGAPGTPTIETSVNRRDATTDHRGVMVNPDHHSKFYNRHLVERCLSHVWPSDPEPWITRRIYEPSYSFARNYLPREKLLLRPARFPESDPVATEMAFEAPVIPPHTHCKKVVIPRIRRSRMLTSLH